MSIDHEAAFETINSLREMQMRGLLRNWRQVTDTAREMFGLKGLNPETRRYVHECLEAGHEAQRATYPRISYAYRIALHGTFDPLTR